MGLLYLAFRNVDLAQFWAKTKEVDYTYIYLSLLLSIFPYLLRAYRWNLLLQPLGYNQLKTRRTTISIIVGYLANLALPRMGEITRCVVLQRTEKVKFSAGLGTVITERIIDGLTLLLVIAITLLLEFDKLYGFLDEYILSTLDLNPLKLAILAAIGLVALVAFFILWKKYFQKDNETNKIKTFIKETVEGLKSVSQLQNFPGFVISSVLIWVSYYFMSYVIVFSIPETAHLGWLAGLSLLVTGGIGMAAPVQGGIGTFHLFVSAMLVSYGIDIQTGVFLATLLHTSQVVAVLFFGGIALMISLLMKPKNTEEIIEDQLPL